MSVTLILSLFVAWLLGMQYFAFFTSNISYLTKREVKLNLIPFYIYWEMASDFIKTYRELPERRKECNTTKN
jgi:hypothetical protein